MFEANGAGLQLGAYARALLLICGRGDALLGGGNVAANVAQRVLERSYTVGGGTTGCFHPLEPRICQVAIGQTFTPQLARARRVFL